jgi:hypothetical protein
MDADGFEFLGRGLVTRKSYDVVSAPLDCSANRGAGVTCRARYENSHINFSGVIGKSRTRFPVA